MTPLVFFPYPSIGVNRYGLPTIHFCMPFKNAPYADVQAQQTFTPWLRNTVRLFANASAVEMEYTVGPIPFQDGLGKEIVSVWSTGGRARRG